MIDSIRSVSIRLLPFIESIDGPGGGCFALGTIGGMGRKDAESHRSTCLGGHCWLSHLGYDQCCADVSGMGCYADHLFKCQRTSSRPRERTSCSEFLHRSKNRRLGNGKPLHLWGIYYGRLGK